jgi:KaiC/GvpD/RAD55 family RecA-like ATPase
VLVVRGEPGIGKTVLLVGLAVLSLLAATAMISR